MATMQHILAETDVGELIYVVALLLFAGVSALSKWLQNRAQRAESERKERQKSAHPDQPARPIQPVDEPMKPPPTRRPVVQQREDRPRHGESRPVQRQSGAPRPQPPAARPMSPPPRPARPAEARAGFDSIAGRRAERASITQAAKQAIAIGKPSGSEQRSLASGLGPTLKSKFEHLPERIQQMLAMVAERESRSTQELFTHLSAGRSQEALIELIQHMASQGQQPAVTAISLRHLTRNELQRAFVMSEVFNPPLALRGSEQE